MASVPNQPATSEVHHLTRKPIEADAESIILQPQSLALQRAPELVLQEAAKAAQALRDVIESKPNKCTINGKTYLQFEDWQTLGRFYGITAAARETRYVERGRAQGYECHAETILVSSGQVIGAAQGECLDDEEKWRGKPLFQLRSMAQTRAQAKALRSMLAWVVVMAGYAPTPAEEMDGASPYGRAIASRIECRPIHIEHVKQLCTGITKSRDLAELKKRYLAAGNEAKIANDRTALDAFVRAKDARKRELQ
jgi:hypothetical protein